MSVIADILTAKNIEITSVYQGIKKKEGWEHHNWKVFISGSNGLCIDEYCKGIGHSANSGVTADDLIPALLTDASFADYDFPEFCREFGLEQYEPETGYENREAKRTWNACKKAATMIKRMRFTNDEMNSIRDYIEEHGL